MTDITVAPDAEPAVHDHDGHHPPDSVYIKVALWLGLLTALEVGYIYLDINGIVLVAPLLLVMSLKFVIVARDFMHLKFDSKLLTRVFYAGLLLAVAVYTVMLLTFHVFNTDSCYDAVSVEECET